MRAVDTNIVVRLLVRDDTEQVEAAEKFVASGAWVSHLVLAEVAWVLDSLFGFDARRTARAVEMLLNHAQFTIQDADVVELALQSHRKRPGTGFSDHLIVAIARRNGHQPTGTFDRGMKSVEGVELLRA